jgi:outer membrane protein TolC
MKLTNITEMKKMILLSAAIFTTMSLMAQVNANTELKSLIDRSFGYFPQIKEVENTLVTAQDKVTLTQLNRLPEVTGNASYDYMRPKIVIPLGGENFQFAPVSNISTAVNASYALIDFGRIKANVQRAKDDLLYAQHNVDNVKSQLAYQVANIYYNIVYLQKAISIQDSVLSFLNDNKQIVESKLKNGDALKIDLLNIQANIDNEGNRKVDLLNSLQKQFNLLEYTTGVKQSNGQLFDFDVTLTDANAALGVAQSSNVDFLLAKDKIRQSQSDLNIVKLGDKPTLGVHAASGVKNGYIPAVNEMKFNYLAGVSFAVPIYNAGKTKQQIRLQQNIIKQNELAVESLSSTYKKDIDQAITDIKSNYERITNTQGQIEEAKYAEELAATRFKNGVGTNLELTNASTNVQRAELTKLQYEYQLCLAKVELARLMGYQYW